MENKETDSFRQAVRNKIQETPIHSMNDAALWKKIEEELKPVSRTSKNNFVWYAAAAVILLFLIVGIGSILYKSGHPSDTLSQRTDSQKQQSSTVPDAIKNTPAQVSQNNTTPANQLAETSSGNTPLPKPSSASGHTVEARNKLLEYKLPDLSLVTLHKGANIRFQDSFKNERHLSLQGEAYFEVQADKNKPFEVRFSDYRLVVVGTKFNIRSGEKSVEITVTEGIVKVYSGNNGIELTAGEQLTLAAGHEPLKRKVEADAYIAWKTGNMDFRNMRLEDVAAILGRQYGQSIVLTPEIKNCMFTGDLSDMNVTEAIKIISVTSTLEVKNLNHKIYLSGPGCD